MLDLAPLTRSLRLLALLVLGASFTPSAWAQLDLPDAKRGAARPNERLDERTGDKGESVELERKQGNQRQRVVGSKRNGGLALPSDLRAPRPSTQPPANDGQSAAERARANRYEEPTALGPQVEFIFEQLKRVQGLRDPLIDAVVASLGRLGDDGLVAARLALFGEEHGPTVLASALTLTAFGDDADWRLVSDRFHARLPKADAAGLVGALADFDPVRVSPVFLASLLDHPQYAVRSVAERRLESADETELLRLLGALIDSDRSDTRLRAIDLAAGIEHPGAVPLLFRGLADPTPKIARHAIEGLTARDANEVVDELKRRAFGEQWILRDSAYALLALMEREDLRFETHIDEVYIDVLGNALRSSDAFVAGTAAAALAGIGFRSPRLDAAWLDREVPLQLVRTLSGAEFHSDYGSLRGTALRRLAMIAGETFGSDGPAWVDWWKANGSSFRARRAWIAATLADAGRMSVRVHSTADGSAFQLVGPELAAGEARGATSGDATPMSPAFGETCYLSASQAQDLFRLIEDEGVFGPERLPGARSGPTEGRTIELGIDGRRKSFRFGEQAAEPWFERLFAALARMRDENRWQRYPDPDRYASRYELWLAEHTWWDDPRSELERGRRLADMILGWAPHHAPGARGEAITELAALYADPDLRRAADFQALIALVRAEPFLGSRARALIDLSLASGVQAARTGDEETLPAALADQLFDAVLDTFGPEAAPELATVLASAGRERVRAAARDERPFLRAVAALTLCQAPRDEDRELLVELIDDPVQEVELATVQALGNHRVEGLRTELAVRARVASSRVRAAALEAMGALGGSGALDVLLVGLGAEEPAVRIAAARGLATLGDPTAAPMLADLLASSRDAELGATAREGLLAMGEDAWLDLLRIVNTPGHPALREAALLLARQGVPEAASALLRIVTEVPNDAAVLQELAVLTCVDFAKRPNPADDWWRWWDEVDHGDAWAWFAAALIRRGVEVPPRGEFEGRGTHRAQRALWTALGLEDEHVVERARRELGQLCERDLGALPPPGPDRAAWRAALWDVLVEQPAEPDPRALAPAREPALELPGDPDREPLPASEGRREGQEHPHQG